MNYLSEIFIWNIFSPSLVSPVRTIPSTPKSLRLPFHATVKLMEVNIIYCIIFYILYIIHISKCILLYLYIIHISGLRNSCFLIDLCAILWIYFDPSRDFTKTNVYLIYLKCLKYHSLLGKSISMLVKSDYLLLCGLYWNRPRQKLNCWVATF